MANYDIVEGTTSDLQFQLLESGSAIDLTGITVTLLLSDRGGAAVSNPGTVSITDATNGKVKLVPTGTSVFNSANGPYYARWKLTDGLNKISYCPTGNLRDVWHITGQ